MLLQKCTASSCVRMLVCLLCLPFFSFAQTKIAVIGDFGAVNTNARNVATLVHSLSPDIIVTVGDNNYGAPDYEDKVAQYYGTFIGGYSGAYPAGPAVSDNRFFPSLGNHDWDDAGISNYLSFFNLPGISTSSSGNERYYDFVYGAVHFFCIDSDPEEPHGRTSTSQQAQWLRTQLAASPSCWKVVYCHHPPYSSSSRHGSDGIMQWPFEDWGADVVLTGHDHTYERIHRDDNADGRMMPYFVCGVGGESLYGFVSVGIVQGSQSRIAKLGAMLITADNSFMKFQFWKVEGGGTLADSLVIFKSCTYPNCDDNNACTVDSTGDGICLHTPIACSDSLPCTADICVSGNCTFPALSCNDNNPCTVDGCANSQCVYTPIAGCTCALTVASLTLVNSSTDIDLRNLKTNDTINLAVTPNISIRANPCQLPMGSVKFILNGSTIRTESSIPFAIAGDNSGDYSKWNIAVGLYTLTVTPYSGGSGTGTVGVSKTITLRVINQQPPACITNANCNDNNPCTNDACQSGQCIYPAISCNDNIPCTIDNCNGGICSNVAKVCIDNSLCTIDTCLNGNCIFTPVNCNDDIPCTNDICSDGICSNVAIVCNDNSLCTTDTCINGNCIFTTINCDDDIPCTNDVCSDGICSNVAIVCNDNSLCTTDTCINGNCIFTAINCNDGLPCTNDICSNGICSNVAINCNDNSLCTNDACVNGICIYTPVNCNDNNLCTNDGCNAGLCVNTVRNCSDNNPCTADGCNPAIGCTNVGIANCCTTAAACNDNNSCTVDACISNQCSYTQSGSQPPYLRIVNPAKSWRKLKMGYSSNSFYSPKVNVSATGNNKMCITLRSVGTPDWNKIQIRPMGSSSAAVTLSNYISGAVPNWTTICIPLSAFSGINFTQLTFLEIPYSNGAAAFEIHIQKIIFSGGTIPFLWFGEGHTNNIHDGQGGSGALSANLVQGVPCGAKLNPDELNFNERIEEVQLSAFPNPFSDKLNIQFTLQQDAPFQLEFFNPDGQRLAEFAGEAKAAEQQLYEFIPSMASTGIIIYRLQTGGNTYYGKAVMIKP